MTEKTLRSTPLPSYLDAGHLGPWATFLEQVDRVAPHLGRLGAWADTLRRPKRCLIVDVPIRMDDGRVQHFEGYRVVACTRVLEARAMRGLYP